MNGVLGIVDTEGRPVDRARVASMTAALAHRGAASTWSEGSVALASFHASPGEAPARPRPIAFHGRIDGGTTAPPGARTSDEDAALEAYARWGDGFAAHLFGDFAVAIWDPSRRALVCARDTAGVKPFFYAWDGRVFAFASEPAALVRGGFATLSPNEAMVGEYLACWITSFDETLLRDVRRLPPASLLRVDARGLSVRRYWDLEAAASPGGSEAERTQSFLDALRAAVGSRLRTRAGAPLGVHVSGGLDSSSLACTAADLSRESGGPPLLALSLAFPGEACDESAHVDRVVSRAGLALARRTPDVARFPFAETARRDLDFPPHPNGAMADVLRAAAREAGCAAVITGDGGDDALRSSPRGATATLRYALSKAARAALPASLVRRIQSRWIPQWIRKELRERVALEDRLRARAGGAERLESAPQRAFYEGVMGAWGVHAREMEERASARFCLDERHPFHDRRLVEVCFALPDDERGRRGETKRILRRAMRGLLPDEVRARTDKPSFEEVFVRALEAQGGEGAFRGLAVADAGWVDGATLRRAYAEAMGQRLRGDRRYATTVWPLWMVLGLEHWLRATSASSGDKTALRRREAAS